METFVIEGGHPISGEVTISGNKNAALPLIAATLLSEEKVTLTNVPEIRDVHTLSNIVAKMGGEVVTDGTVVSFESKAPNTEPDAHLCTQMRASFALAGPLLARMGRAVLPAPGGDRIGQRPLDTHIQAFRALGAHVVIEDQQYVMTAPKGLTGADIFLEQMSVLATENAIMAASLATGETILRNAASEPHVQDVCNLIIKMGGTIDGVGTNTLRIQGAKSLKGCTFEVGPDYIEVGSFIALGAMMGGELLLKNARPSDHRMTRLAFGKLGVRWEDRGDDIFVPKDQEMVVQNGMDGAMAKIHDAPWPGFAPDLTSIAVVLATACKGSVLIHEWMYESRLYWVDRLIGMGARIVVCDPHRAIIEGPSKLYGRTMSSPDIRAGMALVLAALQAKGQSVIQNAQQVDRGYANIETRLRALGANIIRENHP